MALNIGFEFVTKSLVTPTVAELQRLRDEIRTGVVTGASAAAQRVTEVIDWIEKADQDIQRQNRVRFLMGQLGVAINLLATLHSFTELESMFDAIDEVVGLVPQWIGEQNVATQAAIAGTFGLNSSTVIRYQSHRAQIVFSAITGTLRPDLDLAQLRLAIRAINQARIGDGIGYLKNLFRRVESYGDLSIDPKPNWF